MAGASEPNDLSLYVSLVTLTRYGQVIASVAGEDSHAVEPAARLSSGDGFALASSVFIARRFDAWVLNRSVNPILALPWILRSLRGSRLRLARLNRPNRWRRDRTFWHEFSAKASCG